MSIPSLIEICCKNLYENCQNIEEIYELAPNPIKKYILNAGEWYCNEKNYKSYNKYEFAKQLEQKLKIQQISVMIFNTSSNQRIEVSVHTHNVDVYFDIIRNAQELNKNRYIFDSSYRNFPKDENDFCTIEAVKKLRSGRNELFDCTYLSRPLFHFSKFNTNEELIKKINEVCVILQQSDSSTEVITKYLRLDFSE